MAKQRGRGQGEGSIFKRGDGRWCAGLNLGWKNGKRHRKWFYGKTREAVQRQLTTALRNHQLGFNVAPERQTVAEFLQRWLRDCVEPSTRPATLVSYRTVVRLHLGPAVGKVRLDKLSPQHVQAFIKDRLAPRPCTLCKGTGRVIARGTHNDGESKETTECRTCKGRGTVQFSPRSVQYMHSVLSRALNRAAKWDLVPRNVCKLVAPPRVPRRLVDPLSPDNARHFLDAAANIRNAALYIVTMALGLRKGEALGLRWPNVDLEAGTVRVEHALQRRKGEGLKLVEPKSDRSHRTLPLPDFAVRALRAHRARQLQERLVAGSRWKDTGHVFTTGIGTPMDERRVHAEFKKLLVTAELPPMRFHDLRHTAASLLLAQGVHPRVVMETLGHSQISLTLNTYSHVMPSALRDAADKMQALFAGNR
jgi:integrase